MKKKYRVLIPASGPNRITLDMEGVSRQDVAEQVVRMRQDAQKDKVPLAFRQWHGHVFIFPEFLGSFEVRGD